MDKGLKIACTYSWNCEMAEVHGVSKLLREYTEGKFTNEDAIRNILNKLDSMKFYKQIAQAAGIQNPFDERVVSSYWTGSSAIAEGAWHNYTTLLPIKDVPIEYIHTELLDNCMVSGAIIEDVSDMDMTVGVIYIPIEKTSSVLKLGSYSSTRIKKPINTFRLKRGDYIAAHFSVCAEKLTKERYERLIETTRLSLDKFNSIRKI